MKKIISLSLWGDNPVYTQGAIRNAELAKEIYPDWGYGKNDFVHQKNVSDFNYDLNVYNTRKNINFGL